MNNDDEIGKSKKRYFKLKSILEEFKIEMETQKY